MKPELSIGVKLAVGGALLFGGYRVGCDRGLFGCYMQEDYRPKSLAPVNPNMVPNKTDLCAAGRDTLKSTVGRFPVFSNMWEQESGCSGK